MRWQYLLNTCKRELMVLELGWIGANLVYLLHLAEPELP